MGNDGKQSYRTMFYNLDVILSVGYRVNSRNATMAKKALIVIDAYPDAARLQFSIEEAA